MHTPAAKLKYLDSVYHSALRFITGDNFRVHHCILYENVWWQSLAVGREQHFLCFCFYFLYILYSGRSWKAHTNDVLLIETPY